MFKASWWKERGYSEEYSRQIAKGVRAVAREINLREEEIEGLILILELRERLRPSMPLKEFLGGDQQLPFSVQKCKILTWYGAKYSK